MKKILILCLIIMTIGMFTIVDAAVPKPTPGFYVNDFANIMNSEDESVVLQKALAMNQKDGTQIVVVTVKSLNGETIENYAYNLFNSWGIGNAEKNNGVLILLALDDRKSRIEVGLGLEGQLTDGLTGEIQDSYMLPYYKKGDYSKGLVMGFNTIVGVLEKNTDVSKLPTNEFDANISDQIENSTLNEKINYIVNAFKEQTNQDPEVLYVLVISILSFLAIFIAPAAFLIGYIIVTVKKYNKLKEFNLKYEGMAEDINLIAEHPEDYGFTPISSSILGKQNPLIMILIVALFFAFPIVGIYLMFLIVPIIIIAFTYSNKISKFKLKEIKYVCPECKHKGLLHREIPIRFATYSSTGLSMHYFKCPECSRIYEEQEVKPMLTRSSSSYGGSSGGGRSGGSSGGGGRSGGGGSSRSF